MNATTSDRPPLTPTQAARVTNILDEAAAVAQLMKVSSDGVDDATITNLGHLIGRQLDAAVVELAKLTDEVPNG
jgi:hypothetical protein